MSTDVEDDYLAKYSSLYQTKFTRVVPNGSAAQKVVPMDATRVMLRVYAMISSVTVGGLWPSAAAAIAMGAMTVPAPIESKVRDAPDWCTGEWWGVGTDANGWVVLESCYRG